MLRMFKGMLIFSTITSIVLMLAGQSIVSGGEYPTKPITFSIGSGAGGLTDQSGRAIAIAAEKYLGQKIVCVNKPGGGNTINISLIAKAKPDGYLLASLNTTAAILAPHVQKLPYNPLKDITPICQYSQFQLGLVVKSSSPWKTFKEFIDYIQKNPGVVVIGGSGHKGSPHHLVLVALQKKLNLKFNYVPFVTGSSAAVAGLLGGHVTALAEGTRWLPHVKSGDLRLLASFMETRIVAVPDVPTLLELGYGVSAFGIAGICGPPGLPKPVVKKLENAFEKAMEDPEFLKTLKRINMPVIWRNSEEFRKHIAQQYGEAGAFIRELGLSK